MAAHRLRRTSGACVAGPVRLVFLALPLALLVAGCGGSPKQGSVAGTEPSTAVSSAKPAKIVPAPDPGFGAARLGQCYRMQPPQSRASVATGRRVSCRKRHTTVVAYVGFVRRAVTAKTPLAKRRKLGKRVCEPAYRGAAGGTLADRATSILTWTLFTPDQAQLQRGARWVRCDVLARSGQSLVRLPAAQPFLGAGVPEQLRICQNEAGTDVSCGHPHAYRVEAVYRAAGEHYPDATAYTPLARARCKELTKKDGGFWQPPSVEGWAAGDRFIRCLSAPS
ncbi:MAG: septum formation family protein [Marmoricola sp.]